MSRRLVAIAVLSSCLALGALACGGGNEPTGGSGGSGGIASGGSGGSAGQCPAGEGRPSARGEQDGVFVPALNKMFLFGGNLLSSPAVQYTDDMWVYDVRCNVFTKSKATGGPSARANYAAAFDSKRNRIVYLGGRYGTGSVPHLSMEAFAYDPAGDAWTTLKTVGTPPALREGHRAVYDSKHDRILMFGGNTSTFFAGTPVGDFWELDFADSPAGAWKIINAAGGPTPRVYPAMAFHPGLGVMGLFGGCNNTNATKGCGHLDASGSGTATDDFYLFDVDAGTWSAFKRNVDIFDDTTPNLDEGHPHERYWAEMAPITLPGTPSQLSGFVLFGGFDDYQQHWRNDLWKILINNNRTQATYKSVWYGDRGGSGTAAASPGAPERRQAHAGMVSGTTFVVANGNTPCGAIDDVWSFDLTACPTGSTICWYNQQKATTGLTCERRKTGVQTCDDICSDPR